MSAYISEYQYKGVADEEFIEIAVPEGTDVSSFVIYLYQYDGTIIDKYALGTSQGTFDGYDVYVIDSSSSGFDTMSGQGEIYGDDAIALVDDGGNVLQFISHEGNTVTAVEGPAAKMTSEDVGTSDFEQSLQSDDGGSSYYLQEDTNKGEIPACYAPGTQIATPNGHKLVQDLTAGDLIHTHDHGPQMVRWVWSGWQALDDLQRHQKPVLIKKNAIGRNKPDHDLIVSGQHRMVVGIPGQLDRFFSKPAMVPAKALTLLPGIRSMAGKTSIMWHHFVCDHHCTPLANNVASESLLLGPQILDTLSSAQRRQLSTALGRVVSRRIMQKPTLPCLNKRQTQDMLRRRLGRRPLNQRGPTPQSALSEGRHPKDGGVFGTGGHHIMAH